MMDDARHAAYSAYLQDLARRLLVGEWGISLSRGECDDGRDRATISLHHAKDEAVVRVHEDFFGRSPEGQRQTLVHELLHVQTARLCRVVTRLAEEIDNPAAAYAAKCHDEEEEIVVDRLARAIAPLLPLPPRMEGA